MAYNSLDFPFCDDVSKFEKIAKIGEGTFGDVFKGKQLTTGRIVALKTVLSSRSYDESEGFPIAALRQIKSLNRLSNECIIQLFEVCKEPPTGTSTVPTFYLVLEFCDHNLSDLLRNPLVRFTLGEIKKIVLQLLSGLLYIHSNDIFHRDLKASNIFINKDGALKLAGFGMARALGKDRDPARNTNKVVTMWYRPPELLLGETTYRSSLDMWGVGCITAELWTRMPILQGNTEQHQLDLISKLCGSITPAVWPAVTTLKLYGKVRLRRGRSRNVSNKLGKFFECALAENLVDKLLVLDPSERLDASSALVHSFFSSHPLPSDLSLMLAAHVQSGAISNSE